MRKVPKLVEAEREELSRSFAEGASVPEAARRIGREPSSIYRELARTGMTRETYRAHKAQVIADAERATRKWVPRLEAHEPLQRFVYRHIRKRWSPEQIARELKQRYPEDTRMRASHETIYTHIYLLPRGALKKELIQYLRQRKKARGQKLRTHEKRGKLTDMVSIHERPAEVADRSVPGHWESDLIIGKNHKSALGTLVERTTRTTLIVPFRSGYTAEQVRKSFTRKVKRLPTEMRLSLTHDQGKEMAEHRLFTKDTKVLVYFADPGSPWQRGTNENTNGLIRDFFPKGTDFRKVTDYEITKVQHLLNERPRKALDWKTPKECFDVLLADCN
jgi:IS30 family transposase